MYGKERITQLNDNIYCLSSSNNSWKARSESLERYIKIISCEARDLRNQVAGLEGAGVKKDQDIRELRRELDGWNARTETFNVQVAELRAEVSDWACGHAGSPRLK